MAEIMETNMPHIMFLKQFPKSRRHIIRLNQIADYIDADITQVFFVVSAAAELAVFFLLFSFLFRSVSFIFICSCMRYLLFHSLSSYTKYSLHFINKNLIFFYGNFTQFFHIFFVDIYQR